MIVKILLLTCCAATLAQGNSHEDALGQMLAEGRMKVTEVEEKIKDPTKEYLDLIDERREAVEWEHVLQKQEVNRSMSAAVFKGMLRNNQFSAFQCISKAIWPTLEKIDNSANYVQNATEMILQRGLQEVGLLRLLTRGQLYYVGDLYGRKVEELKKAKNDKEKNKILEDAKEKMRILGTILAEVESKAKEVKFKFFEEYVKYAYETENYLKKTAREGGQKALKCVS